jgi:ribosome biogenesis protein ERB1
MFGAFISNAFNSINNFFFKFSKAFMSETMQTSLSARPEHKRSFIPSKWEKLQVGKYVHAIKMGWIKPRKEKEKQFEMKFYDIWGSESSDMKLNRHLHNLPAPKLALPPHQMSYNPPPEYLLNESEIERMKKDVDDESSIFIPKKYTSLRLVPSYDQFIKEQFNRCLDMYLCPRQKKMKVRCIADSSNVG